MTDLVQEIAELKRQVHILTEREKIREVLQRYARGLDRHDLELEQSAFWPNAEISYGTLSERRDAFIRWGNETHALYTARHEHHLTTQTIDLDLDGEVAHVESYVIYLLREKDEKNTMVGGARYIDKLERRHGEWRIALREFLPDILFRANSIFAGEFALTRCPPSGEGRWDRSDLSYQRPLAPRAKGAHVEPEGTPQT